MTTTRRFVLSGSALAGAGLLAGCGTLSQQQASQLQALIAGAQSIEASLSANVPLLLGAVSLPAAQVATVRAALAAVVSATNALASVPTLAAGVAYVQAIESALAERYAEQMKRPNLIFIDEPPAEPQAAEPQAATQPPAESEAPGGEAEAKA